MTKDNSLSLCVRLKVNFPRTSDDLIDEWHDRFVGFDFNLAQRCVERYIQQHDELRTNVLLSLLRDATNKAADTRGGDREQERRVLEERAEIDAVIAEMSDEDLAEHKRAALDRLSASSRIVLGRSDPRTSRAMKALIAESLGIVDTYVRSETGERIHHN